MLECMGISESINEDVVKPSYEKSTRADATCASHSSKMRGEADLSNTYSYMSDISGKHRKRYVDHPKGRYKLTCLINCPRHSSDQFKVLGDFSSKYSKSRPTKDLGREPTTKGKCDIQ